MITFVNFADVITASYFPLLMTAKRLRMVENSGRSVGNSSQQSRISCSNCGSLVLSFGWIGGRNGGVSPPLTRTNISARVVANTKLLCAHY